MGGNEPGDRQFFRIKLSANNIWIHSVKVVPDRSCGFRLATYDSARHYNPQDDPYGEEMEKDLVFADFGGERLVWRPGSPELYVDKDGSNAIYCDLNYNKPPVRYGLTKKRVGTITAGTKVFHCNRLIRAHQGRQPGY